MFQHETFTGINFTCVSLVGGFHDFTVFQRQSCQKSNLCHAVASSQHTKHWFLSLIYKINFPLFLLCGLKDASNSLSTDLGLDIVSVNH